MNNKDLNNIINMNGGKIFNFTDNAPDFTESVLNNLDLSDSERYGGANPISSIKLGLSKLLKKKPTSPNKAASLSNLAKLSSTSQPETVSKTNRLSESAQKAAENTIVPTVEQMKAMIEQMMRQMTTMTGQMTTMMEQMRRQMTAMTAMTAMMEQIR